MENLQLKEFRIFSLNKEENYKIKFHDNKKIIVAENGSRKTTILNILNAVLQDNNEKLIKYDFDYITLIFNNDIKYTLKKENIEKNVRNKYKFLNKRISDIEIIENFNNIFELANSLNKIKGSIFTIKFLINIFNKKFINDLYIENFLLSERIPIETSKLNYLIKRVSSISEKTLSEIKIYTIRKIQENRNSFDFHNENIEVLRLIIHALDTIIYNFEKREEEDLKNRISKLKILFLPTYRRIEQDSKDLFSEFIFKENSTMNFGINDVTDTLENLIETLDTHKKSKIEEFTKKSISDLLGIRLISKTQYELNQFSLDYIDKVLIRFEDIIDSSEKDIIINMIKNGEIDSKENTYIRYFIFHLFNIYHEQEIFISQLNKFIKKCNEYLIDKKFIVSNNFNSIGVYKKNKQSIDKRIPYNNLSSGEKQVIAIFSKLYLSDLKNIDINNPLINNYEYFNSLEKYWILFDEPELSLSVEWQENILNDILSSNNCDFLFCTTHSPFILSDSVKKYASSLKSYREEI
ncbi:MAG TPA: hypothetical protein DCD99_13280 [Acinetobacter schindleri]|nr:hypothetical protein [Acinetobacter schindleri]